MTKGIKFNSLEVSLAVVLSLLISLPVITVGLVAHNFLSTHIRSERMGDVGRVAEAKHFQLTMVLTRANERAELFLADLAAQCNYAKLNRVCATRLMESYLASENALGATLHNKGGGKNLTVGEAEVQPDADLTFSIGQLAKLSGTGPANNRSYFISVTEPTIGWQLQITYPSTNLQPVFDRPSDLGDSGETFLVDGEGYFVTQARYPSTQGHSHPISARPMRACLGGESAEVLDLDYRDAEIVHGYRLITEFGSACIMAHIDQAEAFAPLAALDKKLLWAALIFFPLAFLVGIYMARRMTKPLTGLTQVARSISGGDYTARADMEGHEEIVMLATAFNSMTQQLTSSNAKLQQQAVELTDQRYLLRRVIDSDPNLIFVKNAEGRFLLANEAMAKLYGQTTKSMVGKCNRDLIDDPEQLAAYDRANSEAFEAEDGRVALERVPLGEGNRGWFQTIRKRLALADGPAGVLTIAVDVTDLKLAQERLQKINRALRLLSACNIMMMHAEDEEQLLARISRLLVKTGGYRMAWVGFAERDAEKSVRPVAQAGFGEGYLASANISWADTERGRGPIGIAIRTGVTQINHDFLTNPLLAPWREAALAHGYRSSIALPLNSGTEIFGMLAIYSAEPDSFGADETKLLEELADDLVFGIMTQRLRAQNQRDVEALQQSEEKFRLLVENIPKKIFLKDINSTYLSCNKLYAQGLGIEQDAIVGMTDFDFYPREYAEKYRADDRRIMESCQVEVLEEPYMLDGEERFAHTVKVPFRDRAGQMIGVLGMFLDITDQKRADERLRRGERNLAEAQSIAHLGSWEFDLVNNMLSWSDESYRIFEIDPKKFGASYKAFLDIVHPDDRERVNNVYTESVKNKTPYDIVHRLLMQDGRVKYVHEKCETYYDGDGKPRRSVGTAHDITEQKLAEMRLAESYQELQRLSAHLENLREDERAKIARDLHDEMGSLLVALKMRINWLSTQLPDGMPQLAEETSQIYALAAEVIRGMHQVVAQLRPNLMEGFGFAATVEDYLKKFRQQAGIVCTLVLPEEELALDTSQSVTLFRILQEALNNVVRHAQASQVKIRLAVGDKSLTLTIEDNGVGFDPVTRKEQSFGLIGIRERALMMGGKARITSTPGKGTRVSVTLPPPPHKSRTWLKEVKP